MFQELKGFGHVAVRIWYVTEPYFFACFLIKMSPIVIFSTAYDKSVHLIWFEVRKRLLLKTCFILGLKSSVQGRHKLTKILLLSLHGGLFLYFTKQVAIKDTNFGREPTI